MTYIVRWSAYTHVGPFDTKAEAEAYIRRNQTPGDPPGKVLQLFTPFA
jgi:hypothetical protein